MFNLTTFNNVSNIHVITVSSISKTFYKRCLNRFIKFMVYDLLCGASTWIIINTVVNDCQA